MSIVERGFSILELLVSIAIFSFILSVIVSFLISANLSNIRSKVDRETQENARRLMDAITYEIRNGKSIYTPTTASNQLSLETANPIYLPTDETNTFIDFFLCGTDLCLKKESQNPIILNSDSVEVTSLLFTQILTGGSPLPPPHNPSVVVNDASIGNVAWDNPDNATSSNDVYARAILGFADRSNYLKATGFGFTIPSGATINGIVVEVERHSEDCSPIRSIKDEAVRIVKGGTIRTTDKSSSIGWCDLDEYISYGSSTDLWGETWTASDINATNFGFAISTQPINLGSEAFIDHIRITVTYTDSTSPLSATSSVQTILTVKYKNPNNDPVNDETISLTSSASLRSY